jgi:hypothetical protein
MFKTMALVAIGLLGLCSLSSPAYGIREGGCVRDGRCPLTPPSTIKGKLIKKLVPVLLSETIDVRVPQLPDNRAEIKPMPIPFATVWELQAGDKTWTLDLGGNKSLWKRANELAGKQVVVTGFVTGKRIAVRDLRVSDAVKTELLGPFPR